MCDADSEVRTKPTQRTPQETAVAELSGGEGKGGGEMQSAVPGFYGVRGLGGGSLVVFFFFFFFFFFFVFFFFLCRYGNRVLTLPICSREELVVVL